MNPPLALLPSLVVVRRNSRRSVPDFDHVIAGTWRQRPGAAQAWRAALRCVGSRGIATCWPSCAWGPHARSRRRASVHPPGDGATVAELPPGQVALLSDFGLTESTLGVPFRASRRSGPVRWQRIPRLRGSRRHEALRRPCACRFNPVQTPHGLCRNDRQRAVEDDWWVGVRQTRWSAQFHAAASASVTSPSCALRPPLAQAVRVSAVAISKTSITKTLIYLVPHIDSKGFLLFAGRPEPCRCNGEAELLLRGAKKPTDGAVTP